VVARENVQCTCKGHDRLLLLTCHTIFEGVIDQNYIKGYIVTVGGPRSVGKPDIFPVGRQSLNQPRVIARPEPIGTFSLSFRQYDIRSSA
jgi:hypothetical protein